MCTVYMFTDLQTVPADSGSPHVEIPSSDDQNNSLLPPSPERMQITLFPTDRSVGNKVLTNCAFAVI